MDAEYRQSYLVYQITKSELWLGIVACLGGLPLLVFSPIGGVISNVSRAANC